MTKTTKWLGVVGATIAVLAGAYIAIGGRMGLTLAWIEYAVREESAAYRPVEWQRGPSAPAATTSEQIGRAHV